MSSAPETGNAARRRRRPTGRVALVSDIHANLTALTAVMTDIDALGLKEIWCLGDIVGYGPDPLPCARLVRERCQIILRGNHEAALAPGAAQRFTARARGAIEWTRAVLEASGPEGLEAIEWLLALPPSHELDDFLFVHGSPNGPTEEYLMPRDAVNAAKMAPQWPKVRRYAFAGHTHFPGVFEEGRDVFTPPEQMLGGNAYLLDLDVKGIINVGSVGQPRDHNPRACYAVFDGDSVLYRRVEYDAEATRARILANPALDPFLGNRLLEGR